MDKICKKHKENPVTIYRQCVGCELEGYQQEIQKLREERDSHGPEGRNYTNLQYVTLLNKFQTTQQELQRVYKNYSARMAKQDKLEQEIEQLRNQLAGFGQRACDILKGIGVTME